MWNRVLDICGYLTTFVPYENVDFVDGMPHGVQMPPGDPLTRDKNPTSARRVKIRDAVVWNQQVLVLLMTTDGPTFVQLWRMQRYNIPCGPGDKDTIPESWFRQHAQVSIMAKLVSSLTSTTARPLLHRPLKRMACGRIGGQPVTWRS